MRVHASSDGGEGASGASRDDGEAVGDGRMVNAANGRTRAPGEPYSRWICPSIAQTRAHRAALAGRPLGDARANARERAWMSVDECANCRAN